MSQGSKTSSGLWVTLMVAAALVLGLHADLLTDLNSRYLSSSGDGLKNYYTPIYHVKYDASYSHFDGMNYPYGEQVVFTDNQPILSNVVRFISINLVDISDNMVGIINGSMLVSLILCCGFLFLVFRQLDLPVWYSVLIAIGIGFLSPQLGRMNGHYALAHSFVVPLLLWLVLRFRSSESIKNSLLIALTVLVVAGLHFYYFALTAFFLSGYFFFQFLGNRGWANFKKQMGHYLLQAILPLVVLQIWFLFTDSVTDRPTDPYGFLVFKADWVSVFLPLGYPLEKVLFPNLDLEKISWEGRAYAGIVAGLFSCFLVLKMAWVAVQKLRRKKAQLFDRPALSYVLGAGILLLLLAIGYPFAFEWEAEGKILKADFLLDYAGPLKQFRGVGRFAWVFFYVINILAFYAVYRAVEKYMRSGWVHYTILAVPLLLLFYDGYHYNKYPKYGLGALPELEDKVNPQLANPWLESINPDDFQAIVPLPYFHIGSENFGVRAGGETVKNAFIASMITGLPMTAVQMSRTSFSQTEKNIRLSLEPYRPLEYMANLPNSKPFLLWREKSELIPDYQQRLIEQGIKLYEDDQKLLLSIEPAVWNELVQIKKKHSWNLWKTDTLYQRGELYATDSTTAFYYASFNDNSSEKDYHGSGGYEGEMKDYNRLYHDKLSEFDTVPCVFSAWIYMGEDTYPAVRFVFEELDDNNQYLDYTARSVEQLLVVLDNGWGLIEFPFTPHDPNNSFHFLIQRDTRKSLKVWADEVLIRPVTLDVFHQEGAQELMHNGRYYPL